MSMPAANPTGNLWKAHLMAMGDVTDRLERVCKAFNQASSPYALVGGQAVALWVASRDAAAVRTTKDGDVLCDARIFPGRRRRRCRPRWTISKSSGSACSWIAGIPTRDTPSTWSGPARRSGRNALFGSD